MSPLATRSRIARRRVHGPARNRLVASGVFATLMLLAAACGGTDGSADDDIKASKDPEIADTLQEEFKESGVIKNIVFNNSPPATFVKGEDTVGWAMDLSNAIGDVLGVKIETTVSGDFASFIPGLQSKRYDGTFGPLIVTPERLEQIDIVAVMKVGTGVVSKTGSDISVSEITDLCGLSVAVIEGSAFATAIEDLQPECEAAGKDEMEIRSFPSNSDAQLAVQNGRVQVFASNTDALQYLVQQTGDVFTIQPLEYNPIYQGIGLTKDNGLAEPVAAAVEQLIADGTYDEIFKDWGIERNAIPEPEINPTDQPTVE
jgi:polar amino acid transport system substrate-binding protein